MPRPKKGVTLDNMFLVYQYFSRAIEDNRLWNEEEGTDEIVQATNAFSSLPIKEAIQTEETVEKMDAIRQVLQLWVDKYVPPKKWHRCLKTLRQRKSRKRLRLHHLDLNQEAYRCIKELAGRFDLSLADTIHKMAKGELNRIQENEGEEQKISST